MKWEDLNVEQRREIADILAKERLDIVNKGYVEIVPSKTFYALYIKRLIDIIVSLFFLIITLPINLFICIGTFFDVGSPLIFRQTRIGKDEKPFTIIKFRNMRNTYDSSGHLLPAAQRVTNFGRFVRRTSLDELLNFWSIFIGDMSLIGPRPLVPQYLGRFSKRHRSRFFVRPGLECPPKVMPDRPMTWQDKFENDIWYVQNVSFLVDCKMLINLIRYALDPKMTKIRANAEMGSFMGYDLKGNAITYKDIEQKYFDVFK